MQAIRVRKERMYPFRVLRMKYILGSRKGSVVLERQHITEPVCCWFPQRCKTLWAKLCCLVVKGWF